jgi:hypothetical protein
MLEVTRELIRRHGRGAAGEHDVWVRAAVRAIRRHGGPADAAALLPLLLDDPAAGGALLPVLACHGDRSTAAALLGVHDRNPEVLHAVGYLGHEDAALILWEYALHGDWDAQCAAVLGLVHLRCDGIDVAAQLRRHEGCGLFPELLPALAVKTGDPSWARRLLQWGTTYASTDCNGGLLLGLALLGGSGRRSSDPAPPGGQETPDPAPPGEHETSEPAPPGEHETSEPAMPGGQGTSGLAPPGGGVAWEAFDLALWSPAWETWSASTGTVRWAWRGALAAGLGVADLRARFDAHVAAATDPRDSTNAVLVLAGVLDCWLDDQWTGLRVAAEPPETKEEAFRLLFEGPEGLDRVAERLVGEARDGGHAEVEPGLPIRFVLRQVYDLRRRLDDAVRHETELGA